MLAIGGRGAFANVTAREPSGQLSTRERAGHLAAAARDFHSVLGKVDAQDLLDLVRLELGGEGILDGFQSYAGHLAKAVAPAAILHVLSGNTPHAGLQSLIRGLLLGSHNFCKIPAAGLPEIEKFRAALPRALAACVDIAETLAPAWLQDADALVVFGGDETIDHFRRRARPDQRFVAHGHRISIGVVFDDPDFASVAHAARDASLFDQQGCLSPHCFYVAGSAAEQYAAMLAGEMEKFQAHTPRGAVSLSEAAAMDELRGTHAFREANGERVRVWASANTNAWTVVFDADPRFAASCLNRVIFVRPLPEDAREFTAALIPAGAHLSTVAIWPSSRANAGRVLPLGASRICEIGRMQSPPWTWHQDGGQTLASLVRWIDWEPAADEAVERPRSVLD